MAITTPPQGARPNNMPSALDAGPAQPVRFGVSGATFTSSDQSGSTAAVTDTPFPGTYLVVTDLEISTDTALALTFTEETSGTVVGKYYLPANCTVQITPRGRKQLVTPGKRLMVQASAAGNIAVTAGYYFSGT